MVFAWAGLKKNKSNDSGMQLLWLTVLGQSSTVLKERVFKMVKYD